MSAPLHARISEQLRGQILAGQYPPGAQLPSERQLLAQFGVSRITVRRAIANLAQQGLVTVRHGKGVFVSEQRKVTHSLSSPLVFLADDMAQQGIAFSTRNLAFEQVMAPEAVRIALQLPAAQPQVFWQKKLFLIDGAIAALDLTYTRADLPIPNLATELPHQMTFPTLERHGIAIERLAALLECTRADAEIADCLEVPLGEPLIVYRYTAYGLDGQPLVQGESISRADRFTYALEMRRSPTQPV